MTTLKIANYLKIAAPAGLAALLLAGCGNDDNDSPQAGNTSPMATASAFNVQADTTYTGTLKAADADGDKLTFMAITQPTNGVLTLKSDGSFTYLPNAEFTGSDKFSFNASDSKSASQTVDVTITVDLLQVSFNDYSRKAFNQAGSDKPLPLNSRVVTQDVTTANAYDDLLAK
ncbi:MAG: hypothetical protein EOO53_10760 [Gammaproteobacteria bacterium]|nr:MAG: hypothetical protein EOO53_10760 [Gammaproteobacteria bacterium]